MYRSTATASRPEKWPTLIEELKELAVDSELEIEVVLCPRI